MPGPSTVRYGGNTTCYEVRSDSGELLIIDAGTGIRELGNTLIPQMPIKAHVIFSHTHYDHVIGYPFFVPFFVPGNEFNLYGPVLFDKSFRGVMTDLLSYSFFPVRLDEMAATLNFHDMREEIIQMGPFQVEAIYANHPVTTLAYRITCDDQVLIFTGDTEPHINHLENEEDVDPEDFAEVESIIEEQNSRWLHFLRDADILIYDAQYTPEEYPKFKGWGHTPQDVALSNAVKARTKHLLMTHHDPNRKDEQVDELQERWREEAAKVAPNLKLSFTVEGQTYSA